MHSIFLDFLIIFLPEPMDRLFSKRPMPEKILDFGRFENPRRGSIETTYILYKFFTFLTWVEKKIHFLFVDRVFDLFLFL